MLTHERKRELSRIIQTFPFTTAKYEDFKLMRDNLIKEFTENGYTLDDAKAFYNYAKNARVW